MRCPYCDFDSTRVVDSRLSEPGDGVRRRRECADCGKRFTTWERAEGMCLSVRKRDGLAEPYDRDKLLGGLLRAVTKRPVQVPELEAVADAIESQIRAGGGEADSERIGELALRALIDLDRVAAIRFASVYRRFESLDEFESELRALAETPSPTAGQMAIQPAISDNAYGVVGDRPAKNVSTSEADGIVPSPVEPEAEGQKAATRRSSNAV